MVALLAVEESTVQVRQVFPFYPGRVCFRVCILILLEILGMVWQVGFGALSCRESLP